MERKIKALPIIFFVLIFFIFVAPLPIYAGPQIPPTAEGPGLILPNSPFFFLDEMKQNIRILLAVRPQDKAEAYNAIAGERLAELRFMLDKDDKKGIDIALRGVSENTRAAADSLSEAKFRGHNVEKLAESINTDIKRRQEGLDVLVAQATGELKTMVLGVQTSTYESKAKVVEGLSQGKKEIEKSSDAARQTDTNIKSGPECNRGLIDKLASIKTQIDKMPDPKIEAGVRKAPQKTLNTERKAALTLAYEKLKIAAQNCVTATAAFKEAFNEFTRINSAKPTAATPQK